jgi:hypothetical protein
MSLQTAATLRQGAKGHVITLLFLFLCLLSRLRILPQASKIIHIVAIGLIVDYYLCM